MELEPKMDTEDFTFYGSDPGAVKYGNFINYYTFHSAEERIKHLHPDMFPQPINSEPLGCLDIGCNTGELTEELYKLLKTVYPVNEIVMLAVDIDPVLIKRAQEISTNPNISFIASDIMNEAGQEIITKYLKTYNKSMFDICFCFSVTMWIHINKGDDGFLEFLRLIRDSSRSIVIEPQPWHCYRNAQRRVKKSGSTFPLYESLKIRSDVSTVIESIFIEKSHVKVYESPNSSWKRKIQSYHLQN